jgi:hypothetical protein
VNGFVESDQLGSLGTLDAQEALPMSVPVSSKVTPSSTGSRRAQRLVAMGEVTMGGEARRAAPGPLYPAEEVEPPPACRGAARRVRATRTSPR